MKIKIYKDRSGQWRWRMLARNGKIIADGSESYVKKTAVIRAVNRVIEQMESATVIIV